MLKGKILMKPFCAVFYFPQTIAPSSPAT